MSTERQQLEATIVGLEAQRALLGDAVVDAVLAPLRAKLASLAAVPTDEPPAQTLKQVTILFLDIVGSTTLGQHLDPEATSAVMDGALAQFAAIVEQHGGKVLKYAGDSVLAAFGADEVREDDPERAVRAGLALLEEGRHQGDLVRRRHAHDGFTVRVGVHVGGVLLGGGVDATASSQLILLSCHQVLASAGDPRDAEVLAIAHNELQARAASITDASLRHCFLTNVPENREIVAAWAAQQAASASEH